MSGKPFVAQNKLQTEELRIKVSIVGSSVQADIKTYAEVGGPGVTVYHEDDGLTKTAIDPDTNFSTLDNDAAPAVLGILAEVGDAAEIIDISVPTTGIFNSGLTGAMTAGVVTKNGVSSTGVTALGHIALSVSCTALDIDEDIATTPNCSFWVVIKYRKTQPR